MSDDQDDLDDIHNSIKEFRDMLSQQNRIEFRDNNDMSIIVISAVIGLLVGGVGAGFTVHTMHKSAKSGPVDQVAVGQIDVQLQLTDLDLIQVPCSKDYIANAPSKDLLCREMFCLMQTRGIDSTTTGASCEEISNISNTLIILDQCKELPDKENCYRLFRERK